LLYLPWFPGIVSQTKHVADSFWITKPTLWRLAETLCSLSGLDPNYLYPMCSPLLPISHLQHKKVFVLGGIILLVSCAVAGIWKVTRERRRKAAALLGYSLCPVLLAFFYSQRSTSVFLDRAFIASSAVLSILFGFSVAYQTGMRKKFLWGLASVVLLGSAISLIGFFKYHQTENWRAVTGYLAGFPPQKRLIVFVPAHGQVLFDYYSARSRYSLSPETGLPERLSFDDPTVRPIASYSDAKLLIPLQQAVESGSFTEIDIVLAHAPQRLSEALQMYLAGKCPSAPETVFNGQFPKPVGVEVVRCMLPSIRP
jgi:hypothetical protein